MSESDFGAEDAWFQKQTLPTTGPNYRKTAANNNLSNF